MNHTNQKDHTTSSRRNNNSPGSVLLLYLQALVLFLLVHPILPAFRNTAAAAPRNLRTVAPEGDYLPSELLQSMARPRANSTTIVASSSSSSSSSRPFSSGPLLLLRLLVAPFTLFVKRNSILPPHHRSFTRGLGITPSAAVLTIAGSLLLIAVPQTVAASPTTTCDGTSGGGTGVLTINNAALGTASFTRNAGCTGITLDGCTADAVSFPALTNVAVKITNLNCGSATTPGSCVHFVSTITGGSIDIDGMTRTVSGSTSGQYFAVEFQGSISSVSGISIRGIVLTSNLSTGSPYAGLIVVWVWEGVTGDNTAGSSFNVSDCEVTSGSSVTTSSGDVQLRVLHVHRGRVSGFDTFEMSGNKAEGVSLAGTTYAAMLALVVMTRGLLLTGSAESAIIFRGNSFKGSSVVSTGSWAQINFLHGPWSSGTQIAGASSFIVDGADMRDCTVTAAAGYWARIYVIAFFWSSPLTLVHDGKISISNVWISGEMTYSALDSTMGVGARALQLRANSGIKEISATNSFIDMSKNNGMQASGGSIPARAAVLDFAHGFSGLTSIAASNCSIRGKYSSGSSTVDLYILRAGSTIGSPTAITLTDNTIDASSATAAQQLHAFVAHFLGTVTGAAGGSDTFDVSGSVVRGDYSSSGSYVCAGIAVFDTASVLLTGFEIIKQNAGIGISAQEASPFGGTHGSDSIAVRCGNGGTSSTTTTSTSSTTSSTSDKQTTSTTSTTSFASASSAGALTLKLPVFRGHGVIVNGVYSWGQTLTVGGQGDSYIAKISTKTRRGITIHAVLPVVPDGDFIVRAEYEFYVPYGYCHFAPKFNAFNVSAPFENLTSSDHGQWWLRGTERIPDSGLSLSTGNSWSGSRLISTSTRYYITFKSCEGAVACERNYSGRSGAHSCFSGAAPPADTCLKVRDATKNNLYRTLQVHMHDSHSSSGWVKLHSVEVSQGASVYSSFDPYIVYGPAAVPTAASPGADPSTTTTSSTTSSTTTEPSTSADAAMKSTSTATEGMNGQNKTAPTLAPLALPADGACPVAEPPSFANLAQVTAWLNTTKLVLCERDVQIQSLAGDILKNNETHTNNYQGMKQQIAGQDNDYQQLKEENAAFRKENVTLWQVVGELKRENQALLQAKKTHAEKYQKQQQKIEHLGEQIAAKSALLDFLNKTMVKNKKESDNKHSSADSAQAALEKQNQETQLSTTVSIVVGAIALLVVLVFVIAAHRIRGESRAGELAERFKKAVPKDRREGVFDEFGLPRDTEPTSGDSSPTASDADGGRIEQTRPSSPPPPRNEIAHYCLSLTLILLSFSESEKKRAFQLLGRSSAQVGSGTPPSEDNVATWLKSLMVKSLAELTPPNSDQSTAPKRGISGGSGSNGSSESTGGIGNRVVAGEQQPEQAVNVDLLQPVSVGAAAVAPTAAPNISLLQQQLEEQQQQINQLLALSAVGPQPNRQQQQAAPNPAQPNPPQGPHVPSSGAFV